MRLLSLEKRRYIGENWLEKTQSDLLAFQIDEEERLSKLEQGQRDSSEFDQWQAKMKKQGAQFKIEWILPDNDLFGQLCSRLRSQMKTRFSRQLQCEEQRHCCHMKKHRLPRKQDLLLTSRWAIRGFKWYHMISFKNHKLLHTLQRISEFCCLQYEYHYPFVRDLFDHLFFFIFSGRLFLRSGRRSCESRLNWRTKKKLMTSRNENKTKFVPFLFFLICSLFHLHF